MNLISFVVVLMIVGVLLYYMNTMLPIDGRIKQIINVVVLIVVAFAALFFLLGLFGVGHLPNIYLGPR